MRRPSISFAMPMHGHDDDDSGPQLPLPEAQIATLTEVYERYRKPCPFIEGQLVTARKGYGVSGEGQPHVVLETGSPLIKPVWPADPGDTASDSFGAKLDMRIVAFNERTGTICAWWVDSWKFETYTGER